jgi:hypothetical protein
VGALGLVPIRLKIQNHKLRRSWQLGEFETSRTKFLNKLLFPITCRLSSPTPRLSFSAALAPPFCASLPVVAADSPRDAPSAESRSKFLCLSAPQPSPNELKSCITRFVTPSEAVRSAPAGTVGVRLAVEVESLTVAPLCDLSIE